MSDFLCDNDEKELDLDDIKSLLLYLDFPEDYTANNEKDILDRIQICEAKLSDSPEYLDTLKTIKEKLIYYIQQQKSDNTNYDISDDIDTENITSTTKLDDEGEMTREQSNVVKVTESEMNQGVMNPNIKETVTRIISIDSRFKEIDRSTASNNVEITPSLETTTNFSCPLTASLKNVVSFSLASVEIPCAWYTIDTAYGTNALKIGDIVYSVPVGNYTPDDLCKAVNLTISSSGASCVFDAVTNKCSISGLGNLTLTFFDNTYGTYELRFSKKNSNLGWILGYVYSEYSYNSAVGVGGGSSWEHDGSIKSEKLLDTYGPRYLLLAIDDFNNNQASKGIVGIGEVDNRCDIPGYMNCGAGVLSHDTAKTPELRGHVIATAPRRLTNSQLYTINAILDNRQVTKDWQPSPSNSNIFAKIVIIKPPLNGDSTTGYRDPIIIPEGLDMYERSFFGPVNINRLRVTLLDDMGRILNLNGSDWSFTINVKTLYQY